MAEWYIGHFLIISTVATLYSIHVVKHLRTFEKFRENTLSYRLLLASSLAVHFPSVLAWMGLVHPAPLPVHLHQSRWSHRTLS